VGDWSSCSKCFGPGPYLAGLWLCQKCSVALDQQLGAGVAATDWVLETVDAAGYHHQVYRKISYGEMKKKWASYPDNLDSHFIRPATPEEIALDDEANLQFAFESRVEKMREDRRSAMYVAACGLVAMAGIARGWFEGSVLRDVMIGVAFWAAGQVSFLVFRVVLVGSKLRKTSREAIRRKEP
jgi:hypothetical protein